METVASALASDLFPERRAFIINALQIAFGAGAALSPALAHHAADGGTDWRALYLALAGGQRAALPGLALQRVRGRPARARGAGLAALRAVLGQPCFFGAVPGAGAVCRGRGRLRVVDADLL